jgi:hypothetical protein
MPIKHPIEYTLKPKALSVGAKWLALTLKNVGTENLIALDARLNSLDAYNIQVHGTGTYVQVLKPGEEQELPFQILANESGYVYASLDGWMGSEIVHWESPRLRLSVGESTATLTGLFALTKPYPVRGQRIRVEAILEGASRSSDLRLEFWAETPDEEFKELGQVLPKDLQADEEARYAVEFMPEQEGMYTLYAYFYDGVKRIGHDLEKVRVVGAR